MNDRLRPGMFVSVDMVIARRSNSVLFIPETAVLYAPYGDSVFVVSRATGGRRPAGGA